MIEQTIQHGTKAWQLCGVLHFGVNGILDGKDTITKKEVAIKVFPMSEKKRPSRKFENEVKILKKVSGRKHFPILVDSFSRQNKSYIVMDKLSMDLFSLSKYKLSEKAIKNIFSQLCDAVQTLHQLNIAHLDIKPENVLLDKNGNVVLCDFGNSITYRSTHELLGAVGTELYRAPEINRSELVDPELADVWSLGMLLHVLVTSTFPYEGQSKKEVLENVNRDKLSFSALRASNVSKELKHFIWCLLQTNPEERMKIQNMFHHVWLHSSS